jgi:hypothetical protein
MATERFGALEQSRQVRTSLGSAARLARWNVSRISLPASAAPAQFQGDAI